MRALPGITSFASSALGIKFARPDITGTCTACGPGIIVMIIMMCALHGITCTLGRSALCALPGIIFARPVIICARAVRHCTARRPGIMCAWPGIMCAQPGIRVMYQRSTIMRAQVSIMPCGLTACARGPKSFVCGAAAAAGYYAILSVCEARHQSCAARHRLCATGRGPESSARGRAQLHVRTTRYEMCAARPGVMFWRPTSSHSHGSRGPASIFRGPASRARSCARAPGRASCARGQARTLQEKRRDFSFDFYLTFTSVARHSRFRFIILNRAVGQALSAHEQYYI